MYKHFRVLVLTMLIPACGTRDREMMNRRKEGVPSDSSTANENGSTLSPKSLSDSNQEISANGSGAKLEEASEPLIITGYNLTFDGARSRCTSSAIEGNPGQYKATCLAVEIVKGVEQIPAQLANGISLAWQLPTAEGGQDFSVVSCSTTVQNLAQSCLFNVTPGTRTVDVTFRVTIAEDVANKDQRQRTESDVIVLPYSVSSIGYIPELPLLTSTKMATTKASSSTAALRSQDDSILVDKNWVFSSQTIPKTEFTLANDAKGLECGNRFYFTSRSRLFVTEGDAARHVAGSINRRNLDDLSHPLRTYWENLVSLACKSSHVLIETRSPTRIYDLSPDGVISLVAKDHVESTETGLEDGSIAADPKGNIYYIDGKKIRRRTPSGSTEIAYDGSKTLSAPASLGLDISKNDEVNALIFLDIGGDNGSPIVFSYNLKTRKLSRIAGNGKSSIITQKRDGLRATNFALRFGTRGLTVGRSASGERIVLIGEGLDTRYVGTVENEFGEILLVDAKGIGHVLLGAKSKVTTKPEDGGNSTTISVASGSGGLVLTSKDEVLAKVTYESKGEITTNFVTMPLLGGSPSWSFGQVVPASSSSPQPQDRINAARAKFSSKSLTLFGSDGTFYVIDTNARTIFRQEKDTLIRLPIQFDGDIISATIARDPGTKLDLLIYTERAATMGRKNRIKSIPLSGNGKLQPKTLVSSPECDNPIGFESMFDSKSCRPQAVAVDPMGLVVFYDSGNRLIRRLNKNGTFTNLAGTQELSAALINRSAGTTHIPSNFGFSGVTMLRYDKDGSLFFVESGGIEQDNSGSPPVTFEPVIGKLDKEKITVLVGTKGDRVAQDLETISDIPSAQFQLQSPRFIAPLHDGNLLFEDRDVVLILGEKGISRFFGGKFPNPDCAVGTLDRVSANEIAPTLTNALGRFCAGAMIDLSTTGTCSGGKTLISLGQRLGQFASGTEGDAWMLKLEVACNAVNAL